MSAPVLTLSERIGSAIERIVGPLVLVFLVLPLIVIIPLSFTSGTMLVYPLPGLSFGWYMDLLQNPQWTTALTNTVVVGIGSTVLATALATLAAMGLARSGPLQRSLLTALLLTPMIVPVVVTGVAIYYAYALVGLVGTYTGLILAHAVLSLPFASIPITTALANFDTRLTKASLSLGASPWTTFRLVQAPLIMPALFSGAVFAFATSLDEIVVTMFISSPSQRTIPRQIFSGLRENITPAVASVATVLICVSLLLMLTTEVLRRRSQRS